ncbi:hypothetical protein [Variovorax sp. JS1663]|uniref:hypothetical protein n=1 Tax=Variovorax sp. JS1663 TaxID=1851577 RepID=UPI000B342A96|nr:hypothetical protein [Variovorax sp. JS1663]OUL99862.1 hypothetical protein A8M77_24335 [Variovorax sp. JS1663]
MNTRDLPSVTQLLPGQSLRVAVDADALLLVLEGRVSVVSPPSWFGETVFSVKNEFQEGEVFEAGRGGWIEVSARTAARVQGIPRAMHEVRPRGSRVARLVQLLLPS